ncbi:MAG: FAD-binding oxidoreductase [Angelakisella sp.]
MKVTNEQAVQALGKIVGAQRVLTDEKSRKEGDALNRSYAKAFNVYGTPLPICIVNASSVKEISEVVKYCNENGISIIPRTGASGGEGLLELVNDHTIILDASLMNKIINFDEANMMVTCECGVPLQVLEELANEKGLTTGHTPQSLPMADMGGLVATRSIGQFSTLYGGIEDLLCGLEGVTADGKVVRIRNVPRRAAGPDLRHLFMGSEGALGFITEVTVKLFPYHPESRWMGGYIMKNMHQGFAAIRAVMVAGYKPAVVRLYDKADIDFNFGSVQLKDEEAFMFFVTEGAPDISKVTGEAINRIALEHGGEYIGTKAVEHWMIHRNDLCDKYKDSSRAEKFRQTQTVYSTTEIAASWTDIVKIYDDVMKNVPPQIDNLIMLGGHVSHSYINGTNIYFVYQLKMKSPETSNDEHTKMVHALCNEVLKYETGGCVHHHGMGKKRIGLAHKEHGTSYPLMIAIKKMMDPNNTFNPGALVTVEDFE